MKLACPSMNQVGGRARSALATLPWNSMWYWKMWVSSWRIRSMSSGSGRSTGSTIRKRTGLANAPTPSGMKFRMMLFCSKAEWVW
jgi:hypothetical protein